LLQTTAASLRPSDTRTNCFAPPGMFRFKKSQHSANKSPNTILPPPQPPLYQMGPPPHLPRDLHASLRMFSFLPQTSESRVQRQTRDRIKRRSLDRGGYRQGYMRPRKEPMIQPRTHNAPAHGKKRRARKNLSQTQHIPCIQPGGAPHKLSLSQTQPIPSVRPPAKQASPSRPLDLWPQGRTLLQEGCFLEAFELFERVRDLAKGSVPKLLQAHLGTELAGAALKIALDPQSCSEEDQVAWLRTVQKEATDAMLEFENDQSEHGPMMLAFAHLLRAVAALETVNLEEMMETAAALLVEHEDCPREQMFGYQALIKALVSVLYKQGRREEAVAWKGLAGTVLINSRKVSAEEDDRFEEEYNGVLNKIPSSTNRASTDGVTHSQPHPGSNRDRFDTLDTNGDGIIDKVEFEATAGNRRFEEDELFGTQFCV